MRRTTTTRHLATFISAQWCAAIPNARILEFDVDDVPWREELTTAVPEIIGGGDRDSCRSGLGGGGRRGRPARAPLAECERTMRLRVVRFTDYRSGPNEVVLPCRKTDELPERADLVDLVAPQRVEP